MAFQYYMKLYETDAFMTKLHPAELSFKVCGFYYKWWF